GTDRRGRDADPRLRRRARAGAVGQAGSHSSIRVSSGSVILPKRPTRSRLLVIASGWQSPDHERRGGGAPRPSTVLDGPCTPAGYENYWRSPRCGSRPPSTPGASAATSPRSPAPTSRLRHVPGNAEPLRGWWLGRRRAVV